MKFKLWLSILAPLALLFSIPSPPDESIEDTTECIGPCVIGHSRLIAGRGTNGNDPEGAVVVFKNADDETVTDGYVINGLSAPFRATGGGLENLRIVKKCGHFGGRAVVVTALNSAERSGEYTFRRLKIFKQGALAGGADSAWQDGFVVDGSMLTTSGAAGIRRVMIDDVRVAGVLGRSFFLNNAVHCCLTNCQVDPGGVPLATFEIKDGQNIEAVNLIIHGDLILTGSPVEVSLHGRFHTIRVGAGARAVTFFGTAHFLYVEPGATGAFHGHISEGVANQSTGFKVF